MPNTFAYLMLIAWPLFAGYLFKKFEVEKAAVLALIVPYLILPVNTSIDFPLVPALNKSSVPALVVFYFLFFRKKLITWLPQEGGAKLLSLLLLFSTLLTWWTNREIQINGPLVRPGLTFSDVINVAFGTYVSLIIPFVVGACILNKRESHKLLLRIIVCAGLFYSLLMLYEIRMSPQLHNQIYGFFPHSWIQQIRQGGFRPVVFLGHGLLVAMLAAITFIGIVVFVKTNNLVQRNPKILLCYMFVVVLFCKTMSALVYGVVGGMIVFLLSKKKQVLVALMSSVIVLFYPALRSEVVPVDWILKNSSRIDEERGASLAFRLENEEALLEKANQRPIFGWGGWARSRVYAPYTGESISVTDGTWIIIFGELGWAGYIGRFGLFFIAIFATYVSFRRKTADELDPYTAGLCVILAINLIDLIPNSSYSDMLPLIAGALWGRAKYLEKMEASKSPTQLPAQ